MLWSNGREWVREQFDIRRRRVTPHPPGREERRRALVAVIRHLDVLVLLIGAVSFVAAVALAPKYIDRRGIRIAWSAERSAFLLPKRDMTIPKAVLSATGLVWVGARAVRKKSRR